MGKHFENTRAFFLLIDAIFCRTLFIQNKKHEKQNFRYAGKQQKTFSYIYIIQTGKANWDYVPSSAWNAFQWRYLALVYCKCILLLLLLAQIIFMKRSFVSTMKVNEQSILNFEFMAIKTVWFY